MSSIMVANDLFSNKNKKNHDSLQLCVGERISFGIVWEGSPLPKRFFEWVMTQRLFDRAGCPRTKATYYKSWGLTVDSPKLHWF
jgi:hypothetical protein